MKDKMEMNYYTTILKPSIEEVDNQSDNQHNILDRIPSRILLLLICIYLHIVFCSSYDKAIDLIWGDKSEYSK